MRLLIRILAAALLLGALAACTSSPSSDRSASAPPVPRSAAATARSSAPVAGPQYYVSLGDSYAAGYQATGAHSGHTTRNGFAYQLVTAARAKGYHLQLVNFGCAGATTTSILRAHGCRASFLGPGARSYGAKTQAAAAEQFLRSHRGHIALITVSIGGNDIIACGAATNPVSCLSPALTRVTTNLSTLLTGLRAAAGPSTPIVGTTYPDVFLGNTLSSNATLKELAPLSVVAFRSLINPTLQSAYQRARAQFVDVTRATGAYGSMSATTRLAPYGVLPVPVAQVCRLTYYCQYQDIHPRTNGYALIARLILAKLPTR